MPTKDNTRLVRPLEGGQIAIPAEFLDSLGIDEQTTLRITMVDGGLWIAPVRAGGSEQGSPGLKALYEYFAPVRAEIETRGITQDELYADIDLAIAAVRDEQRAKRG